MLSENITSRLQEALALQATNPQACEAICREILQSYPHEPNTLILLGSVRLQLGDHEGAAQFFGRSLAINPHQPLLHNNYGVALHGAKDSEAALQAYDRALALNPQFADAHNNRGNALRFLRRYDEALAAYEKALSIKPDFASAWYNYGLALQELRRFDEALEKYQKALLLIPDYADVHWNIGTIKLLTGKLSEGWPLYEWRWKRSSYQAPRRNFPSKLWLGDDDLKGKSILLYAEQGFGDTIHFCRYVDEVAKLGATVILEVQAPLKTLMQTLKGASKVLAFGEALPSCDYHCPLLSLPLAFKTDLKNIPVHIPYLHADAELVKRFSGLMGAPRAPRVGIVWAGNPEQTNDRNRSMALIDFLPLLQAGIELISLQKDLSATDRVVLSTVPLIRDAGSGLRDFKDTAAAIEACDLIISVCTSAAHLAGALGKPLWILLSHTACWRWLLDREDSVWYPSARLFRQKEMGQWEGVIQAVLFELKNLPTQSGT